MLTLEFNFYFQIFVACIHSVSYYKGPILSVQNLDSNSSELLIWCWDFNLEHLFTWRRCEPVMGRTIIYKDYLKEQMHKDYALQSVIFTILHVPPSPAPTYTCFFSLMLLVPVYDGSEIFKKMMTMAKIT